MTRLTILAALVVLAGCDASVHYTSPRPRVLSDEGEVFRVVTIDGCQYLDAGGGQSRVLTHKGNCANPIHKHQESEGKQ